jgi:polysaccharide biosynthesis transport protein
MQKHITMSTPYSSSTRDSAIYASDNSRFPSADYAMPAKAGSSINLADLVRSLRRNWLLPLFGLLTGLAIATAYIALAPDMYKSTARLVIDTSVNRYLQTNKIVDAPIFDDTETSSQMYVLGSESVIIPVVRSLNLAKDPEFVGPPAGQKHFWDSAEILKSAKRFLGLGTDASAEPDNNLERTAVETFFKRLTVDRVDTPSVINVTFASEDSKKAATIANAVVESYIANSIDAKLQSTRIASQMIQERLPELKQQAMDADRVLQEFKIANNLVSVDKGSPSAEQILGLSTQLANSKVAIAEAKARLDRVQNPAAADKAGATVPDNEMIVKLRLQYRELSERAGEIENRTGPGHIAVVKLRSRMEDINVAIKDEQQRIAVTYAGEYQLANARKDELTATVAQVVKEAGDSSQAQVTMRELESSADTLHGLYNSFLLKYNEINKVQAQSVPVQDARIITRAAPALQKNSKKSLIVLGASLLLGLLLGAGASIAKEWATDVFRTADQVKQATNHYSVTLPTFRANWKKRLSLQSGAAMRALDEYVLDAPFSRATETFHNIRALISTARRVDGDKVFCVVSTLAKEGKTTISSNLAALMSAAPAVRTLIIDADMHQRQLTTHLAPDATEGLLEAMANPVRLASIVTKRERSGVDVLPCVLATPIADSAALLGSAQMERLLDTARATYDCIIIEIPPILLGVDVKMIERFVDKFIFVVEWGKTKRKLVQEALSEAANIRDRIMCIVLNDADPAELRTTESYKRPGTRGKL